MKTIVKVAGAVAAIAAIATGIGAALGGTMMLTAFGGSIAASTIAHKRGRGRRMPILSTIFSACITAAINGERISEAQV